MNKIPYNLYCRYTRNQRNRQSRAHPPDFPLMCACPHYCRLTLKRPPLLSLPLAHSSMNHALYTLARHSLYLANRLYAQWSFCVNYALYTFLYLFLRGIPPTTSTRPSPGKAWHPAVFISDAHSPVGKATAILLAQSGYVVFAGVPTLAEGTSLVNAFTSSNTSHLRTRGGTIHSLLCISTDPVSIRAVATTVAQSLDATNPQRTKLVAIVCLAHLEQIAPLEHTSDTSISVRPHPARLSFTRPLTSHPRNTA